MILAVDDVMKLPEFAVQNEKVIEEKLNAAELMIRAYTNNNFQNRFVRFTADSLGNRLLRTSDFLKVGDTVQISQSMVNDGLYTITEIGDDFIRVNQELYKSTNLITKSVISSVFNAIKSTISSILNSIKSTFTSVWNSIKSTVSNVINGVKSTISSGLNAAKSTISNILGAIKEKFSSIFEGAKNIVSNAINRIKSFFNFSWSLPHLKLPHISISGSFSLTPPSVPHFGIDWYKKAMDDGMIMNQPTIFGYNAKSNQFLAGGEAGSETVVGTQSLMDMIRVAVNEENASLLEKLDRILTILESYMPFIPQLANLKLVTDTGVLAGELAPAMDEELGKIFDKEGRR